MGFFNYNFENSNGRIRISISEQGWVYLTLTLPLTMIALGLSYAWIRWAGTKQQKYPVYSAAAKAVVRGRRYSGARNRDKRLSGLPNWTIPFQQAPQAR